MRCAQILTRLCKRIKKREKRSCPVLGGEKHLKRKKWVEVGIVERVLRHVVATIRADCIDFILRSRVKIF